MTPEKAYEELVRRVREEALLGSCEALLEWDEETYMPPGGAENRSRQMALLAGLVHERGVDPRVGELLDLLEGSALTADPRSNAAVNVRELRRAYERERRLPRTLVEEAARVTSLAQVEWAEAREENDWKRFQPWLERIVRLRREEAECIGYRHEPYDAMLDDFEPGATTETTARLLHALRDELAPLLHAITGAPRRPDPGILRREFPVEAQRAFAEAVAASVGFDFERGRLDESTHPFSTSIGPGDCRITTRFSAHDFGDGFFAVLHEVGHGLYEQGLDEDEHGLPMGEQVSVGMDESQSRLWENAVGRSHAFWRHFFPQAQRAFPAALGDVQLDAFHFAVNAVSRTLIRVDADEVTYDLHILVRFELERALVRGDLHAVDVPGAWHEGYLRHLGVAPANDAEGCLQDGHWAEGLIGYFPTYTLGNVFAAQLLARATQDLGDLDEQVARGELRPLLDWLRANVHRQGSRYPSADLVEHVTGAPPDHGPLVARLRRKYGGLYGL